MSFRSYGFPNTKAAGEWVESVFMVKAGALGLAVSKPFGDSQPYDFLVANVISLLLASRSSPLLRS
jgi:hypothetical protein